MVLNILLSASFIVINCPSINVWWLKIIARCLLIHMLFSFLLDSFTGQLSIAVSLLLPLLLSVPSSLNISSKYSSGMKPKSSKKTLYIFFGLFGC
jgi:hypothetical protein